MSGETILTEADFAALESASNTTLAKWWSKLNKWECPDEIDAADLDAGAGFRTRRDELMGWIHDKITLKECLRDWNKDSLPGANFDQWWDGRKPAGGRHERG